MARNMEADDAMIINDPLFTENTNVEHVVLNRFIEEPMEVRQEGNVTVIPVIEEVVVLQKRLMLKEEVRITRRKTGVREPRRVDAAL